MDSDKTVFNDPDGRYAINIPSKWTYAEKSEKDRKALHQFKVSQDCVFQISCNTINERVSKIIADNNIKPHDFNLPNISFVEKYHDSNSTVLYSWMALIGEYFYLGAYYYNPETKDAKEIGLDLMDVRMMLRFIKVQINADVETTIEKKASENDSDDTYSDIEQWRNLPTKFFDSIGPDKPVINRISPVKVDALRLYALLVSKISHQPNGFFDLMKVGKPLDNPIWWDYVLECDKGFIQIWRTPFLLEASLSFDGEFDLEEFLNKNIERYKDAIDATIAKFDRHTIYINHYQSYRQCVTTLWEDISKIDLTVPHSPQGHYTTEIEMEKYTNDVELFHRNSVKYHALAKSLVLNAAFKIESFLNLIIRIGCTSELRMYPDVLLKFTKQDFQYRLKNIRFYTKILVKDFPIDSAVYRDTKQLMTLRNKYVHNEEDAIHNRLGETYYDRDYPLYLVKDNRPAIETAIQTFHHPNIDTVRKAYETSNQFVDTFVSLFDPAIRDEILMLINQNPIGYNESRGMYSAIYMPISLDFFTR